MSMAWTKEQNLAIYTRGSNIVVSAGAGSGKTAVLSERMLDFVLKGNNITEALVLTFTNAAASEMKERIRKKLIDNKLYHQAALIDSAYITTFDAYSLGLVKKYSYKLGISKDIKIMDKALETVVRSRITRGLFTELYEAKDERFLSLLTKYTKQDDKDLHNILNTVAAKLELIIDLDKFIESYEEVFFNDEHLDKMVCEYERLTLEAVKTYTYGLNELASFALADGPSQVLYEGLIQIINELNELKSYDDLYMRISALSHPRVNRLSSQTVKDLKKKADDSLKKLKTKYFSKYVFTLDMKAEILSIKNDTLYLLELCMIIKNRLFEYKKSISSYAYVDIAMMAIKLVREDIEVNEALKYGFKEILIDECQDTSDIQEAFINSIANNNVYMVGDIKQSIYRFRNANPYIFKSKYDNYSKGNGGIKIDLLKNFRSRSTVLDDINLLFNKLMTEDCGDASYRLDHQMNYGLVKYDEHKPTADYGYNTEMLTYSDLEEYKDYSKEEVEAFIVAKHIKDTIASEMKVFRGGEFKEIAYGDFAILIDKAKSFVTFKQIFEHMGIPLSIEGDLDLKDSILPKLFSNILTLIYKKKNKAYDTEYKHMLASIARSFIYEETDDAIYRMLVENEYGKIHDDFRYLASLQDISYSDLFFEIVHKLDIYSKLPLIGNIENSLVILEYIHNMFISLNDVAMSLYDSVEYLNEVFKSSLELKYNVKNDSSKSVRIMTIHKSKGLEFPVVYFPLLSSQFNKDEQKSAVGYDKKYGFYIPFVDDGKSDTIIKPLVVDGLAKADVSEKVRLLYVAFTRAREKMVLVSSDYFDEVIDNKYTCFNQMIRGAHVFDDYIKPVSLEECNISFDYKQKKDIKKALEGELISYQPLSIEVAYKNKRHASKELHAIVSDDLEYILDKGTRMHEILESIDLANPRLDDIEMDENEKAIITSVLSNEIFTNIKNGKAYHEYEFYYENDNDEIHGIIDLFIEYEDYIDIIDYKLSNVDSEEYINQLECYRDFIRTKTNKPVNIYLLSLMKNEIKKL